jgi:hypothetical protein
MRLPSRENLAELVDWEPPHGVLSVQVEIDPGDRAGGWRVALRDELDRVTEAVKGHDDRDLRAAVDATAGRIAERFPAEPPPSGRVQIGFVECTAKPIRDTREEWFAVQYPVLPTRVEHSRRPHVRGLADILERGRSRSVVAVSSERIRLLEWRLGSIEERAEHEITLFQPDWRERKSQSTSDPATAQGVSASGRDQFGQRLEHNRMRFLKESGRRCADELGEAARSELILIGDPHLCEEFLAGWEPRPKRHAVDNHDVIAEPAHLIGERVSEMIRRLESERVEELTKHLLDAAMAANGTGALGLSDTARALTRGQVEHLVIDGGRRFDAEGLDAEIRAELEAVTPVPDGELDEWIIHAAIRTSAAITTLHDETAERLAEHGGLGAILRY